MNRLPYRRLEVRWKERGRGRICYARVRRLFFLDFAFEGEGVKNLFAENRGDMNDFFRRLFLIKGKALPKGKLATVIDEVQLSRCARHCFEL